MVNTRLLTRSDVERLLDLPSCIEAVEHAFRSAAQGALQPSAMMGIHAPTGSFHIKAASLPAPLTSHLSPLTAVKVNANFPANPAVSGLPTIQGLLLLFDAATGSPLAVMDSIALTILRTAAATGIAARHLAAPGARTVALAGCGAQASAQLAAVCLVRPIERAVVVDSDPAVAHDFARAAALRLGIPVTVAAGFSEAAAASDIVVTCTTSRR